MRTMLVFEGSMVAISELIQAPVRALDALCWVAVARSRVRKRFATPTWWQPWATAGGGAKIIER